MKARRTAILTLLLAATILLPGCIFVEKTGHRGGHCFVPPPRAVCDSGHFHR